MTYIDAGDQVVHPPERTCPDTLDLFAPRARTTDPDTSHEAAESVTSHASGQRLRCLTELAGGPLTADAIDARVGWRVTTAGRRLPELQELGAVTMLEAKGVTRSGRTAHLWAVASR